MTIGISEAIPPEDAHAQVEAVRSVLRRSFSPQDLRIDHLGMEADGAIVVAGQAENLATKKRALRLAAFTGGALGVVDRLHVRVDSPVEDRQIAIQLSERFALDPRFKDLAIYEDRDPSPLAEKNVPVAGASADARGRLTIEVVDGIVVLDGTVPSLVRKRLAGAIAWRIPGVRDVINGLAVEPPEQDGPDELEEAIREVLDGHPLFDDTQVKAGVYADIVRLTGLVHTAEARQAAEDEVWRVLGVDEVINKIETTS